MWVPMRDTVLVKKIAVKDTTEGGIVLPVEQQGLTLEGTVTHVSDGYNHLFGKKVLFSKFSGSEVKVNSESLLIIRVDDILAVWQGE